MGQVLAVISGKGGTGKTSVCAGVAGCLCLEGARVLCIDADLGLRNLDISLGMASEASVSFLEVMRGDYTLEQAPRAAGLSGLQLLTAPVSVCAEDLDEAQFASLIDEARRRYDWVLLDAPAGIGAGFDLAVRHADELMVVCLADPASQRDAARAAELALTKREVPAKLVVNRVSPQLFRRMNATVDDIMDVIEEEATEDIERMAGVMDDSDTEYLDMGVFRHARNRLPWLLFMTVTLMLTGFILTAFEEVLSQVIILVSYLPLLMGTGGNVGTQAASLIIRGMSVGDLETRDALKVLWKEFRVSVVIGLVLSIFNFTKIILIDGQSVMIALTVAVSMLCIVSFGKLLGSMLPIGAKRIGIDPALMATPMIQSISDMVSSTLYMLIAAVFLGITL